MQPYSPKDREEIIISFNGEMYIKAYDNEFFLSNGLIQNLITNFAMDDLQKVEFNVQGYLAESKLRSDWIDDIKTALTLLKMKG